MGLVSVTFPLLAASVVSNDVVVEIHDDGRRLALRTGGSAVVLHPLWLRERSTAAGAVDPTNRQRLYEPMDITLDLRLLEAIVGDDHLDVEFSDGHRCTLQIADLLVDAGLLDSREAAPQPVRWHGAVDPFPYVEWGGIEALDPDTVIEALTAYYRYGFIVVRNTPTEPESLHVIAGRFGRVSATGFGDLFDVRTEPNPTDMAYTPVGLSAHSDQPYRRPVPGVQFLHTLVNDAPGGDSTVVDGLTAVEAMAALEPDGYDMLRSTDVEFRYDIGTDVLINRAPMIEYDGAGRFCQLRFSPRLDFAPAVGMDALDAYYRARRWLSNYLNDPANQLQFGMRSGDAMIIDNHRVLHGRTPFDPTRGRRHLQGCYIDHDGPDTMWRLAIRAKHQRAGG